jgi:hypothetical protein
LQVLQTPAGEEVLVTNAGQDKVYVFTVFSPEGTTTPAQSPPSFTSEAPPGFVFTTTGIEEAPFAVVVTIAADTLPGGSGGSTAQFLQATQTALPVGDAGDAGDGVVVAAATNAPGFVPGDGTPGIDLYRRTDEPDFIRPLSRQRFPDAPWEAERMLAALAPDGLPVEGPPNPAAIALSGDAPRTNPIPAEVAVATLEARSAADLVWLGELTGPTPNQEGREVVPAVALVSSRPGATASRVQAPTVIASDEWRGRWVALLAALPGVGFLWRPGDKPAEGVDGTGQEDRRSWTLSKSRQLRQACRAIRAGGKS